MATETVEKEIFVRPIKDATFTITIVGDTPLLCNKYSDDKSGDRIKDPTKEYLAKLHYLPENGHPAWVKYGFPGSGIKAACIATTGTHVKAGSKPKVRGAFFIIDNLVPVLGGWEPIPYTIPAKTKQDYIIMTTRAMFEQWYMKIRIKFLPTVLSEQAITNIINWAGTTIGIGSYTPAHNGTFGTFHVWIDTPDKDGWIEKLPDYNERLEENPK